MHNQRLLTWMFALVTGLAAAATLWLAWRVLRAFAPVAIVIVAGGLLALLLLPLADRVHRAIRSRPLAALAVVLLVLAPFVVGAAWLVTTVVAQAQGLLTHLPAHLTYARALLSQWQAGLAKLGIHVNLASQFPTGAAIVLQDFIHFLSKAAAVTTDSVLALIVAFILLWDGAAIVRSLHNRLPASWRAPAADLGAILSRSLIGYIRAQLIVAAVFGVIIGGAMALLGLPDPVLLGFLAGLFEMLPMVGPILAAVGPVGLALAQPFPHVIWVLLVFVAAQQLESNVLVPRISGAAVLLHPLTVILAVFAGWGLAGLFGAFLAVPVTAIGRDVLDLWWPRTAPQQPPRGGDRPRRTQATPLRPRAPTAEDMPAVRPASPQPSDAGSVQEGRSSPVRPHPP